MQRLRGNFCKDELPSASYDKKQKPFFLLSFFSAMAVLGIGYLILSLLSLTALVYALHHLPSEKPPPDDEGDGGTPIGGDSSPRSDLPPTLDVRPPGRRRRDVRTGASRVPA